MASGTVLKLLRKNTTQERVESFLQDVISFKEEYYSNSTREKVCSQIKSGSGERKKFFHHEKTLENIIRRVPDRKGNREQVLFTQDEIFDTGRVLALVNDSDLLGCDEEAMSLQTDICTITERMSNGKGTDNNVRNLEKLLTNTMNYNKILSNLDSLEPDYKKITNKLRNQYERLVDISSLYKAIRFIHNKVKDNEELRLLSHKAAEILDKHRIVNDSPQGLYDLVGYIHNLAKKKESLNFISKSTGKLLNRHMSKRRRPRGMYTIPVNLSLIVADELGGSVPGYKPASSPEKYYSIVKNAKVKTLAFGVLPLKTFPIVYSLTTIFESSALRIGISGAATVFAVGMMLFVGYSLLVKNPKDKKTNSFKTYVDKFANSEYNPLHLYKHTTKI